MTRDSARRPEVVLGRGGGAWAWTIWVVPAGLAVWAWRGRAARPWALAGLAVFVAAVGPVLGLTPFMFQYTSTVADHYLYVAMFGPALVLTWVIVQYRNRGLLAGIAVGLAALALRSHDQLRYWRDDLTLWTHGMNVCPSSFVARANVAADLGRAGFVMNFKAKDLRAEGRVEEAAKLEAERLRNYERAVELLEEAIRIRPTYMVARHNAVVNYLRLGRPGKAAEHMEAILAAGADRPADVQEKLQPFHVSTGSLWLKAGEYARAIPHFEKVLARDPEHSEAKEGLAQARAKLAAAEASLDLKGAER
jgi:tetratricopeptide (TPR) repeat protein